MASDEPSFVTLDTPQNLIALKAEIRRYDEVLIASVRVSGASWRDASSVAFRPLANYIFGGNADGEKIGMTTPVTTHKVASDTGIDSDDNLWEVRFFMPPRYDANSLPDPQSPYVRLDKQNAVRFAAITFNGPVRDTKGMANFASHEALLRNGLAQAGLPDDGVAHYAVYNGPWTPSMMRRNEVLIALD